MNSWWKVRWFNQSLQYLPSEDQVPASPSPCARIIAPAPALATATATARYGALQLPLDLHRVIVVDDLRHSGASRAPFFVLLITVTLLHGASTSLTAVLPGGYSVLPRPSPFIGKYNGQNQPGAFTHRYGTFPQIVQQTQQSFNMFSWTVQSLKPVRRIHYTLYCKQHAILN